MRQLALCTTLIAVTVGCAPHGTDNCDGTGREDCNALPDTGHRPPPPAPPEGQIELIVAFDDTRLAVPVYVDGGGPVVSWIASTEGPVTVYRGDYSAGLGVSPSAPPVQLDDGTLLTARPQPLYVRADALTTGTLSANTFVDTAADCTTERWAWSADAVDHKGDLLETLTQASWQVVVEGGYALRNSSSADFGGFLPQDASLEVVGRGLHLVDPTGTAALLGGHLGASDQEHALDVLIAVDQAEVRELSCVLAP